LRPRQLRRRRLLVFGQSQTDHIDASATKTARDEIDAVYRQGSTDCRRMIEMDVEIISQRQSRLLRIDGNAVDRSKIAKSRFTRHHEVAEQMRIRCRAGWHIDKEAIQRLAFSGGASR